jgi:hypothetical protein
MSYQYNVNESNGEKNDEEADEIRAKKDDAVVHFHQAKYIHITHYTRTTQQILHDILTIRE